MRLLLLLALLTLQYLACSGNYYVGHTGDDVMYLSSGRALARGYGYVDLHFPGHPPHVKYPPGYPTSIAVGELLFPENLTAQRGLTMAVALACVGLTLMMLPQNIRWLGALLTGSNVMWAQFATTVDSAPLYALLLITTVILFQNQRRVALGFSVAAAIYTRTVGVVLFPALFLATLKERRYWVSLVLAALLIAPYFLSPNRLAEYRRAGMTSAQWGENELVRGRHLEMNLQIPLMLWGNPWYLTNTAGPLKWLVSLAGWLLLANGARRAGRLATTLTLCTLGIHAVYAYFDFRYYVPILPFLYWLLLEGCTHKRLRLLVIATVLAGNLAFTVADARRSPQRTPFERTYAWLKANHGPHDIITAEVPEVWLYTGLPLVSMQTGLPAQHPEAWLQSMRQQNVTLVLLRTTDPFCEFVAKSFPVVHLDPQEQAVVFRVPAQPTGASASP